MELGVCVYFSNVSRYFCDEIDGFDDDSTLRSNEADRADRNSAMFPKFDSDHRFFYGLPRGFGPIRGMPASVRAFRAPSRQETVPRQSGMLSDCQNTCLATSL